MTRFPEPRPRAISARALIEYHDGSSRTARHLICEEKQLKIATRLSLLLAALVLMSGLAIRPAQAQSPNPKYDPVFARAKSLEANDPDKALDEYARVKNDNTGKDKDKELAADALLRAALFASDPARYGTADQVPATGAGKAEAMQKMQAQGEIKAHEAYKQLLDTDQFADTSAARYAQEAHLREQLEQRIDKRNSQYLSYKIVDSLVKMTGNLPWFSYWFALVLIAVVVKAITMPLTLRMYRSQREMQRIQPILKEIQEKYKGKPELNEKIMAAYKEHGVNPFASCLPMLVQLPFLWWIYSAIRLYEFHFQNGRFLWIGSALSHQYPHILGINLGHFDMVLLVIYAASNYLTMKLTPATDPQAAQQQKSMSIMMTIFLFWMFTQYRWSAAFTFYWLVLNIFSAWQQYTYIYKPNKARLSGGSDAPSGGAGESVVRPGSTSPALGGNGNLPPARPTTPIPGGNAMRPRPRRPRRK
jgi:YidC/Oxa1 family membrane protein insertase